MIMIVTPTTPIYLEELAALLAAGYLRLLARSSVGGVDTDSKGETAGEEPLYSLDSFGHQRDEWEMG